MTQPLPDAAARESILTTLDTNLVVEAAAGTGKTTALIGRIVTMLHNGKHRFAAVTFTHKAAAELRQRLDARLTQILADPETSPEIHSLIESAREKLPDCHIGTIHSFCARLLRERPVEAGVSPDFTELEDDDDMLLRTRAWERFTHELSRGEHRDLYRIYETFGLDLDTLGQGFSRFAEFPDIDHWPGKDAGLHQVDATRFMTGVESYHAALLPVRDSLAEADPGTDSLMALLQVFVRRFPRLALPLSLAEAYRLSRLFKENPKPVLKQWKQLGLEKDAVLEIAAAYRRFFDESVLPFRNQALAAVYGAALLAYEYARDIYDALRREAGVLNFQDLLMASAAMLRDYPDVRADLAERFPFLLIDEVQDTDPIQAEIMFLLASREAGQRDWRRCTPRPGSLFIVGDPKQSIYRFRRADIVVYQEIKKRIRDTGGTVLELSTNFRSQPTLLDWVNTTFCPGTHAEATPEAVAASGCFHTEESPYSPAYFPLMPGRSPASETLFHGLFRLETLAISRKNGITEADILSDEARRIAGFIRHAVDTGLLLPDGDAARPACPGDFLIITYKKSAAAVYATALRRMGLDCDVSSGATLGGSQSLELLSTYLDALDNTDDGILLLSVLRGPLFGIADPDLYRWKKEGHPFSFLSARENATPASLATALGTMRQHWRLFQKTEPTLAVQQILDDLGLWPFAALGEAPSTQVGAVATALELLRREKPPTLGKLRERLAWLRERFEKDPLPAAPGKEQSVRIMNLHKTKGLEAPVVFLTSTRSVRAHAASFAVRRAQETSAGMALRGGQNQNILLARPADWDSLAEEEELYLAAEKTRLNYVAATRAGAALVVSVHSSNKVWKSHFLPRAEVGSALPVPLPEPKTPPRPLSLEYLDCIDGDSLRGVLSEKPQCIDRLTRPSYALERAKPDFTPTILTGSESDVWTSENSLFIGEVLHRLLQENRSFSDAKGFVLDFLRDAVLPLEWSDRILEILLQVQQSDVWKRANQAEKSYREIPYTITLGNKPSSTLQRGVIDLVFKESSGWVIVDYKLDTASSGESESAAQSHGDQLGAYARAWQSLTNERVIETGILFLRPCLYVPLITEKQGRLF